MALLLGDDFKLYRDTADNYSTPTWSEVINADELGFDQPREAVAFNLRGVKYRLFKSGKIDATINFSIHYDSADAHITEFEVHHGDAGKMHLGVFDGDSGTSGSQYWHGWFGIADFNQSVNQGDPAKYEVTAKPHVDETTDLVAHATIA